MQAHCLTRDPDYLLTLSRKLAYRVEADLVPLDPTELECPDRASIQRCFLLADHGHLAGLDVFHELEDIKPDVNAAC